jgi:hypothetical protein
MVTERVSMRWKLDDLAKVKNDANRRGEEVSKFIRKAALERVEKGSISHIAGQSIIEYNTKKDNFIWKIKTDNGQEKILVEDASPEFLVQLLKEISTKISDRDSILKKKTKKSVSVPRRLVE